MQKRSGPWPRRCRPTGRPSAAQSMPGRSCSSATTASSGAGCLGEVTQSMKGGWRRCSPATCRSPPTTCRSTPTRRWATTRCSATAMGFERAEAVRPAPRHRDRLRGPLARRRSRSADLVERLTGRSTASPSSRGKARTWCVDRRRLRGAARRTCATRPRWPGRLHHRRARPSGPWPTRAEAGHPLHRRRPLRHRDAGRPRLGELVAERFGVEHEFIDVPNPV